MRDIMNLVMIESPNVSNECKGFIEGIKQSLGDKLKVQGLVKNEMPVFKEQPAIEEVPKLGREEEKKDEKRDPKFEITDFGQESFLEKI